MREKIGKIMHFTGIFDMADVSMATTLTSEHKFKMTIDTYAFRICMVLKGLSEVLNYDKPINNRALKFIKKRANLVVSKGFMVIVLDLLMKTLFWP